MTEQQPSSGSLALPHRLRRDGAYLVAHLRPSALKAGVVRHRHGLIGLLLTVAGGSLWGINATVSKVLMSDYGASPIWIACVREVAAGLIFLAVALAADRHNVADAVRDVSSWPWFIAIALTTVLLVQVSYLSAIKWTNSGTATVLQSLSLIFVLVWVCARQRRRPRWPETVGVLLAFAGTALIATEGDLTTLRLPLAGLLWGLADALGTAAMAVLPPRMIAKWGNFLVNGLAFLISGLILVPVVRPWSQIPSFDARGWALMAFTVIGGTFGAYWLYLAGMMRIGSMRATMLGTAEPVMATVSSVVWLGAVFAPTDLAGFALILAMVFLIH